MDMTQEEIKEYNERSRKEFEMSGKVGKNDLFGFVIPLFLFFAGMSVPFFTDEILVMWFALVPFYVYTVFYGHGDDNRTDCTLSVTAFVFCISLVLTALRWFVLSDMETNFATVTLMAFFNLPCSFVWILFLKIGRYIK